MFPAITGIAYLASQYPNVTRAIPATTLIATYPAKGPKFPD